MKIGMFADLYRKIGKGLGWLEPAPSAMSERSEEEIRRGLLALEGLRKQQVKWRNAGVTREEVWGWISEGRRV